jgi:hypothetical protein
MLRLVPALISLTILLNVPHHARAADKFDVWINFFSSPQITILSVEDSTGTSASGGAFFQTVRGTVGGANCSFTMKLQRGIQGLDEGELQAHTRSKRALARYWSNHTEEDIKTIEKLKVRRGFGVTYSVGGARYYVGGINGRSNFQGVEYVFVGAICTAGGDAFTNFFAGVRPATREQNLADFAAFGRPSSSAVTAPPEPKAYRECEAAKGNDDRMATFMQSLTPAELSRFLGAGQSCETFKNE